MPGLPTIHAVVPPPPLHRQGNAGTVTGKVQQGAGIRVGRSFAFRAARLDPRIEVPRTIRIDPHAWLARLVVFALRPGSRRRRQAGTEPAAPVSALAAHPGHLLV